MYDAPTRRELEEAIVCLQMLQARHDALEKAIECHYRDGMVPPEVASIIPFHAYKLNERQTLVKELRETAHMYERLAK